MSRPASRPDRPSGRDAGRSEEAIPEKCHVLSCSPCRRRSSAVPFLHIVAPSRSVPCRSAPCRPRRRRLERPRAAVPVLRAFRPRARARPRARFAPARFAHLIARTRRQGALLPSASGEVHGRPQHCVMRCHVLHAVAEALRFRSCISSLRRVPFRSMPARAAAGLGAPIRRDPFCARILHARLRLPARVLRRRGSRT